MDRYGDFFPENPQSLDELLEIMAKRMAAMASMLNSMTPEQRQQLADLASQFHGTTWTSNGRPSSSPRTSSRRSPTWAGTATTSSAATTRCRCLRRPT